MARKDALYEVTQHGTVMRWTFKGGQTVDVDTSTFAPSQREKALMHGVKQKVSDAAASAKGDVAKAYAGIARVADGLRRGIWGMAGVNTEDLIRAIAEVTGIKADDVKTKVNEAGDDKLKEWASNPQIAAKMTAYEAKRAQDAAQGTKFEF